MAINKSVKAALKKRPQHEVLEGLAVSCKAEGGVGAFHYAVRQLYKPHERPSNGKLADIYNAAPEPQAVL